MLSEMVIHSSPDTTDTSELRIEYQRGTYNLTAASCNDRNLWLRKMRQAQAEVLHSDKCKLQRQQSSECLNNNV